MHKLWLWAATLIVWSAISGVSPAIADQQKSNLKFIESLLGSTSTEPKNSENNERDITTIPSHQEVDNHGLTHCEQLPKKSDIEACERSLLARKKILKVTDEILMHMLANWVEWKSSDFDSESFIDDCLQDIQTECSFENKK